MLIQLYNGNRDNTGREIDITAALRNIIDGPELKAKTDALHKAITEKFPDTVISKLKSNLPAVTWSGTFAPATVIATKEKIKDFTAGKLTWQQSKEKKLYFERTRAKEQIKEYSQLLILDFDDVTPEEFPVLYQKLCNDPYTYIAFLSPSHTVNNGFKVLFQVAGNEHEHYHYFLSVEKYILETYGKQIDKSGKDISRLCYLCHNEKPSINDGYKIFDQAWQPVDVREVKPFTKKEAGEFQLTESTHDVFLFTEKKISYTPGNRNRFLNLFSNNCNRKGIPMSECFDYCKANMQDREIAEITQTVENAYNNNPDQFAQYAKKSKAVPAGTMAKNNNGTAKQSHKAHAKGGPGIHDAVATQGTAAQHINAELLPPTNGAVTESDQLFWYTTKNEKTGKETLSLHYTRLFDFLEDNGFYNLKIDNTNVELIRQDRGIVDPVIISNNRNDVKTFVNRYCKEHHLYKVLEMLHRGEDKYFARKKFINLNYKAIEFLKDSAEKSFYFHSNCVVEVTAHGITTREYRAGEKALWRSQIIERDFKYEEFKQHFKDDGRIDHKQLKSEWAQFQVLASSHPEKQVDPKIANDRFYSHATSFGFLVNGYKPSDAKAIVGVDHQKGIDRSQQNGRTGKGLLAKALGFVKKRYNVNGRTYDPRDNTVFDAITMDVKVITITDCGPNFDFGNFFVPITEDFTFRKLYVGYVTIPFALSPKWYFDTNFSFKGDGGSFEGRQHIIEFDNFFTPTHRPQHYFGHQFFIDWEEDQWNAFYNYAYWCDMLYKSKGLIAYPSGNYEDRKLMNECPEEFVTWLDAIGEDSKPVIKRNFRHKKLALFEDWKKEAEQWGLFKTSAKTFTKWMHHYCNVRSLEYITEKKAGVEYAWISDGTIQAEKLKIMGEIPFDTNLFDKKNTDK